MIRHRLLVFGMLAASLAASVAAGLETDQYYAWGRELEDSAEVLNAKFNLEIEDAARTVNLRGGPDPAQCIEVAKQLRGQLHFSTLQDIEVWTVNSSLVSRAPADDEEQPLFRSTNLYHAHGPLDVGMWLLISPTIEAAGVRFGTDKLAHFVSSGWRWYRGYRQAIAGGMSPREAEERTIRTGVMHERTGLGGWSSGVISLGDLEASYQGMRFYDSLCHGDDPILELADGLWKVRRPYGIGTAVGPEWDESYSPPIYSEGRWRKVEPVLRGYCDRLGEPNERARRSLYRAFDTTTPVERVVMDLIEEGRLEDPARYSIESVCGVQQTISEYQNSRDSPDQPLPREPDRELEQRIQTLDSSVGLRRVGLLGVHFSRPEQVAGSVAMLFAQMPKLYSCKYLCTYSGSLVQLTAGLSGGRLSAGWGKLAGERKNNRLFLSDVLVGYSFKGTFMRTWHDPIGTEPDRWYLGGEFEGTIVRVNFRLGAFYMLEDPGDHSPWLLSAGIGWGF